MGLADVLTFFRRWPIAIAVIALYLAISPASVSAQSTFQKTIDEASEREAYAIALEAYLYGYPRVEMARRVRNETNRIAADQVIYAPANRFFYFERLARPGDGKFLKAANNDTLYASAFLDLSRGPVVLRVPPTGDRLYVALMVDGAGAVFNRLSSRVSGPGGVDHVFVPPNASVPSPPGARASPSPVQTFGF